MVHSWKAIAVIWLLCPSRYYIRGGRILSANTHILICTLRPVSEEQRVSTDMEEIDQKVIFILDIRLRAGSRERLSSVASAKKWLWELSMAYETLHCTSAEKGDYQQGILVFVRSVV